jgi:hypothetical protein
MMNKIGKYIRLAVLCMAVALVACGGNSRKDRGVWVKYETQVM